MKNPRQAPEAGMQLVLRSAFMKHYIQVYLSTAALLYESCDAAVSWFMSCEPGRLDGLSRPTPPVTQQT